MVKTATTPTDYAWFAHQQTLVYKLSVSRLADYSIKSIVDNKLASKNFKKGLVFTNRSENQNSYYRLFDLVAKKVLAELPYLRNSEQVETFISADQYRRRHSLDIIGTPSVGRYLRRLARKCLEFGIPVSIHLGSRESGLEVSPGHPEKVSLIPTLDVGFSNYKVLAYIPEVIKVIKTLSRKATFLNEHFRAINTYAPAARPTPCATSPNQVSTGENPPS